MKISGLKQAILAATAGTALAALATDAAFAEDFVYVNKHADITKLCGTKQLRVALVDGYGGNSWRRTALAELKDEAAKCPNITDVQYTDAAGDAQAYNSAINGYTAQGYDIIVTFTDFGDAALPAYRAATQAGVTMAPYFNDLKGKLGVDYSVNPYEDAYSAGKIFAEWVGKSVGEGNTIFLGGLAGSASSVTFLNGYKEGLKKYPKIKLLDDKFIVTNWSPADAQKAVSGLIAKYPKIDAIASDYGVTSLAAVKAYQAAGLTVPAMAFIATNNEYSCLYMEAKATGKAWKQLALSGTTADTRFALRAALAKLNGIENTEPRALVAFPFADSEQGKDPACNKNFPPDADLASSLPQDKLQALFKQ
ncbi:MULTISPECIES: substrate-binding domain-containing protein [Rhizobium/Agrobacterium group]|uniref:substrate-binding domain-containing protein n=1 Tax=Rhizobium/Agrobacterium group TaxID=227290 RepID=UPI001ADC9F1B|nr:MULTISPECIES: substrate-binding domain-containing protein [Rhizobium/Agrobacterium group]MBO9112648.1 substrate-binding domain-containing protein [Agrobacterium sp. S2/73]QXZ76142.1 substrate-binding domain-containing protein [Agrobacterium sp. S7/73]QYA17310.1 substrate-binding domain-containing protein [Rhizobium sp. AB2/73]UEQ85573.1 substrate-binding domain-containing protein [Rhizobium sp. AB2/73]